MRVQRADSPLSHALAARFSKNWAAYSLSRQRKSVPRTYGIHSEPSSGGGKQAKCDRLTPVCGFTPHAWQDRQRCRRLKWAEKAGFRLHFARLFSRRGTRLKSAGGSSAPSACRMFLAVDLGTSYRFARANFVQTGLMWMVVWVL